MRLKPQKLLGRLLGMLIVGAFVLLVLVTLGTGVSDNRAEEGKPAAEGVPQSPVSVREVQLESIEITYDRAGTIWPLRRFTLGFEIAGRVEALGETPDGKPLDEGDPVAPGQLLARLDNQVLTARVEEARARLSETNSRKEQASSDLQRLERVRKRDGTLVTEDEYEEIRTQLAIARSQVSMAQAQLNSALKNLADSELRAPPQESLDRLAGRPATGADSVPRLVLSKRMVNVGESVNPQQSIMELLRVDQVLLVVGVPEASVGNLRVGQPAHVELLARDRFRRKRPRFEGRVYRVAEAADDTTSLFAVEILLANPEGQLRPGLIALGRVVIDCVQGFRIPLTCAVSRDNEMFLFSMSSDGKAHRFRLEDWIEQDGDLVLSQLPPEHRQVIVRGQHRLVDGRPVRRVDLPESGSAEVTEEVSIRALGGPKP